MRKIEQTTSLLHMPETRGAAIRRRFNQRFHGVDSSARLGNDGLPAKRLPLREISPEELDTMLDELWARQVALAARWDREDAEEVARRAA